MTPLTRTREAANGQAAGHRAAAPAPAVPRPQRRNWVLAAVGVLVVAGCALIFAAGWLQAGHRQPVLALARPVAPGQPLTAADLTVVRASVSGPVSVVPASQETSVLGRLAAGPLPAGALLTDTDLGTSGPPSGQQDLGVAVKPGQYPPDLSAGQTVDVLSTPSAQAAGGTSPQPPGAALPVGQAVVLGVDQSTDAGVTVVELRLSQNAVPQVAAAASAGQISLATIAAGG
jgi:hypothetical protein